MVVWAGWGQVGMKLEQIQPLQKLGIELRECDGVTAEFFIPLEGNKNDKGSLFAGSQYSALVLCGWYLTSDWAANNDLGEKVAIKDSQTQYQKAAYSDLKVTARFDTVPDKRPSGHWRARVTVQAKNNEGQLVSQLTGDYRILVG